MGMAAQQDIEAGSGGLPIHFRRVREQNGKLVVRDRGSSLLDVVHSVGTGIVDPPEIEMLVQVFPYDHQLPSLPILMAGPPPTLEPLVLARFGDNPSVRARTTRALACLWAMHGEFDRARELIQTARAMFVDLGQTYALASSAESSGLVEMLAGDLSAAEQELRRGVELLEGMGERAYLSTLGAMLADVLELVDRDDEAGRFARTSEKASDPDDIDSQARWRAVKSKLLAKQGRLEEAEALAREAVRLAAPTDVLNLHGHCYLALGAVLEALGRQTEASEAFARAVQVFSRKGNLAAAGQARARMPPGRR